MLAYAYMPPYIHICYRLCKKTCMHLCIYDSMAGAPLLFPHGYMQTKMHISLNICIDPSIYAYILTYAYMLAYIHICWHTKPVFDRRLVFQLVSLGTLPRPTCRMLTLADILATPSSSLVYKSAEAYGLETCRCFLDHTLLPNPPIH